MIERLACYRTPLCKQIYTVSPMRDQQRPYVFIRISIEPLKIVVKVSILRIPKDNSQPFESGDVIHPVRMELSLVCADKIRRNISKPAELF